MSTRLGKTSWGFTNNDIWTSYSYVIKETIPDNSQIVAGGFYGGGNSTAGGTGTQSWRVVVYDDTGSSAPGNLLGYSQDAPAIAPSDANAYQSITFTTPIDIVTGQTIWLGIQGGTTTNGYPIINVGADLFATDPLPNALKVDTFGDGPLDPYGTPGGTNTEPRAMWVDYDPLSTVEVDNALPDADVTTTGWTTTPLWSKVNDSSDASYITATAS